MRYLVRDSIGNAHDAELRLGAEEIKSRALRQANPARQQVS